MNTPKEHHHAHHAHSRSPLRLMALYGIIGLFLLAVFLGVSLVVNRSHRNRLDIPDEKAAGATLLMEKFTGPRYFQMPPGDARDDAGVIVASPREPHITAAAARDQVERIANERGLTPDLTARVRELINRLTEQPKSRLVGEEHVNVLRLNLALDELK